MQYLAAPGAAAINATVILGQIPWVISAYNSLPISSLVPMSSITAKLTTVAADPGLTKCSALDGGSLDVEINGLPPPGDEKLPGWKDACNAKKAFYAAASADLTTDSVFCGLSDAGYTPPAAILPAFTSSTVAGPEDRLWDVIVVGSGISGLAAASSALKRGLSVLMLEGRTRVGGRLYTDRSSVPLAVPVELGAGWFKGTTSSSSSNPLMDLVTRFSLPYVAIPGGFRAAPNYVVDSSAMSTMTGTIVASDVMMSSSDIDALNTEWASFVTALQAAATGLSVDAPLSEVITQVLAADPYAQKSPQLIANLQRLAQSRIEHEAGAETSSLSAKQFLSPSAGITGEGVYLPLGMDQLASKILSNDLLPYTGNFTLLNSVKVIGVDYTNYASPGAIKVSAYDLTKASLNAGFATYKGRSVIVTVPLGVLKRDKNGGGIDFTPPLPSTLTNTIQSLGMGNLERYAGFVSGADSSSANVSFCILASYTHHFSLFT